MRKSKAFTAENLSACGHAQAGAEHAESSTETLMLYLSDLCALCGKMLELGAELKDEW